MARSLRIEYPGAVYHVMNRGNAACTVFHTQDDYQMFLDLIKETIKKWDISVHAFSLMPNHYHMLVETPLGNLQRAMRHINGVYTQRHNRKRKKDGHLFRGRYKAILVEEDAYLVELLRYIHLNPVRARITMSPQDHKWSSHRYYLGNGELPWLATKRLLAYFGRRPNLARRKMHKFVLEGVPEGLERRLKGANWPSVFSSENFEEWIKWNFVKDIEDREIKYESAEPNKIDEKELIKIVSEVMNMSWREIANARGREAKLMRGLAIRCFRNNIRYDHEKLSSMFGNIHPTNISRALNREPEGYEHIWERLQIEIQNAQNAKRKT
ncbi:MAG: hypothetical protein COV46_08300 [Deltaproteobacteria bacterium CG11_big_fil_rev_8_21_14_0_20_49_13]|nr:MAG: hypothetical protein COV46_08300 [Deltaproteobacteria bacterium CG11_big_fil_rev_8_21_14_0_20_49_13]